MRGPPGVWVRVDVEGGVAAYADALNDGEEIRVLLDVTSRDCLPCELSDAIALLAEALLDRAKDHLDDERWAA